MTGKKATLLSFILAVALVSAGHGDVVGNFEGGLDGWQPRDAKLTLSTTGATAGTQALQVDGPGGWHINALLNAKPYLALLGTKGVKVTADVTAVAADMTTPWMQVEMIINAQNNDSAGANNNIGWNGLGAQDVIRDGQPHTYTWVLPDTLTAKIAVADAGIQWFELALVTNLDGGSVTKFYIDNIQIVGVPVATGKSTDTIIGNWEQTMDGWVVGGSADARYSDVNGVTLGKYSLDVWVPTGAWATVLTLNLLDPNQAAALAAFRANTKITADITHKVADWPVDDIPPWNGTHLIINTDAGYMDLGYRAGWSQNNGDRTDSVTWDYSQQLSRIDFSKVTYLELMIVVNANSADYAGWVWFYIDNMKFSGGGIVLNPQPANGAKDVDINTLLGWSAGAHAATHHLYLGTSQTAVNGAPGAGDPSVTFVQVDGTSFDPNTLQFNTQYFWRVDAVNDVNPDSPWKGVVWTFTTANAIIVDNFESYTDDEGNRIYQTWVDGFENPAANGATVGNFSAPFAERKTVHAGLQAMPLAYDNTKAKTSEAIRTWAAPQDWTRNGYNTMKLFVYGMGTNGADAFYIALKDSAGASKSCPLPVVLTTEAWTEYTLATSAFAGVNLAAITQMTIGVGNPQGSPSKATGRLYVDDIQIGVKPLGLVAYYKLEGNLEDSSGNGLHGTFGGNANLPAKYVSGPTGFGQGLLFDGTGGHQNVELGTFNPSAATGKLTVALWAKWDGASDQWQGLIGKRDGWALDNMMWHIEVNRDSGTIGFARYDSYPNSGGAKLPIGTWAHVAVTFDGTTARFYLNGAETGSGNFSFGLDTESALHFGSDDPNGGNAFNGALDEVRLYDTVLSTAEILKLAGK
ncbi:MAG: LamG domain-containing protein [Planctomycetes bacterium]|jgi:hypothetical protein|nr:LamG domain-containing protein [Planctomycetota bacterium]